jgi:4-hydroxybenzoate polyprenyltransferase
MQGQEGPTPDGGVQGGGQAALPGARAPVYVHLERAVVRTSLFFEALLSAIKAKPWLLLWLPVLALRHPRRWRQRIGEMADLDVATLPYSEAVLDYLREEKSKGRALVAVWELSEKHAKRIAGHLGLFDDVVFIGDRTSAIHDAPAEAILKSGDVRSECFAQAGKECSNLPYEAALFEVAHRLKEPAGGIGVLIETLRPHHWAKNLLVFAPLLAAHQYGDFALVGKACLALVAMCLMASATYLVNDLLDLSSDRAHPHKRMRPFASGRLSLALGSLLAPLCAGASILVALALPSGFLLALGLYLLLTLAYSWRLKRVPMLDVIVLAGLFTLRVIAGGAAVAIPLSFWPLTFSLFVFFSLALSKRYTELLVFRDRGIEVPHGRGYRIQDLPFLKALGLASGLIAVLVVAFYVNSPEIRALYREPQLIWLLCPIGLYMIARLWLWTHRGGMPDDPLVFVLKDRPMLAMMACAAAILYVAR